MITKEQIEEAASIQTLDCEEYTGFVAGANWALAQCPYSREDMMNFARFCSHQFDTCDSFGNWYILYGEEATKTTQQLLKEWEEQK